MSKKFETSSEESIRIIMESMRMVGFECHLRNIGEEGGIFYKDKNGGTTEFDEDLFSIKYIFPNIGKLVQINGSKGDFEMPLSEVTDEEKNIQTIDKIKVFPAQVVTAKFDFKTFDHTPSNDFDAA